MDSAGKLARDELDRSLRRAKAYDIESMNAVLDTAANTTALLRELAAVLPPECLLSTPEQTAPFECDGLSVFRQVPLAVVMPQDEAQVQQVLRDCHRQR